MLRVVTAILSRLCTRSSEGSSAARNSGGATYLRADAHSELCGVNISTGMPNIVSVYTPGQTPEQTTTASNTTAICPSFTRTVHPCLPSHANTLPIAPTSFMAVQPAHVGPSMALRIETFGYHGSLSRYTPKRGRSVPLPTSQQVQYEGQERPGTRPHRHNPTVGEPDTRPLSSVRRPAVSRVRIYWAQPGLVGCMRSVLSPQKTDSRKACP